MTRQGTIFNISGLNLLQSQANLGRLWEFHGSSLEVVWEKSGNNLLKIFELSRNSKDLLGDLVSNLLSFMLFNNNLIFWVNVRKQCDLLFIVLFTNNFLFWENVGKQGGLLWCVSIYKRISFWFPSISTLLFWQYKTSVLSESSPKEVLLFLFPEHLAQPGRACLLCFTPEFDKVLVSLAHRCLGASLCQIRVWSSANSWFPLVAPDLLGFWGNQLFGCPVSSPSL